MQSDPATAETIAGSDHNERKGFDMADDQDSAEREIGKHAGTYSADVEIGDDGKFYYARDIAEGEVISIPLHMIDKAHYGGPMRFGSSYTTFFGGSQRFNMNRVPSKADGRKGTRRAWKRAHPPGWAYRMLGPWT